MMPTEKLSDLIAALRERTWLSPVTAEEMNRRDRWLADELAAVLAAQPPEEPKRYPFQTFWLTAEELLQAANGQWQDRLQVEAERDEWIARFNKLPEIVERAEERGELSAVRGDTAHPPAWQPIETAPKDGRLILAYPSSCWTYETEDCEVIYWDGDSDEWGHAGGIAEDYTGPTHWQPLPAPPPTVVASTGSAEAEEENP